MLSGFYSQSNEDGRLKSRHDPLEALEKRPDFFVSEEDFGLACGVTSCVC